MTSARSICEFSHPKRAATVPVLRQDIRTAQSPRDLTAPQPNTKSQRSKRLVQDPSSDHPPEEQNTGSNTRDSSRGETQPLTHWGNIASPHPHSDVAATCGSQSLDVKSTRKHSVAGSASRLPAAEAKLEHWDDIHIRAPLRSETSGTLEEWSPSSSP